MTFSDELRQAADPIFEAIFRHPFVQGIAKGEVPKEALTYYVRQDSAYLNTFIKVYALAISKCQDREDMRLFNQQISYILDSETHPHHNFCRVAGADYGDLQNSSLAPTASHYIKHMLAVAYDGSLAETIAAFLPCPWTYWEIGSRIIKDFHPEKGHPFYDWIMFYGKSENDKIPLTLIFAERLNQLTENTAAEEKAVIKDHFIKSCQLEYAFWDMAYTQERWPAAL